MWVSNGVPDASYPGKGNTLLGLQLFINGADDVLSPNELVVLEKWHREEFLFFA